MARSLPVFLLSVLFLIACKDRKKEASEPYFPTLDLIRSQVAHVDTSVYGIVAVSSHDSISDSSFIPREQFRAAARDFLDLPDLAAAEYADRYTETKQFDQSLNRVIMTYTPVNPEKELIQNQQVLIEPSGSGDQVTNIIVNLVRNSKDSSVQKRMMWSMDKSFQVTRIKQLPGQPETTSTLTVTWNPEQ